MLKLLEVIENGSGNLVCSGLEEKETVWVHTKPMTYYLGILGLTYLLHCPCSGTKLNWVKE